MVVRKVLNGGFIIEQDLSGWSKPQVPPLRCPGFPVEVGGVGELPAAFLNESRTRGRWRVPRGRKSGYASVGACDFFGLFRKSLTISLLVSEGKFLKNQLSYKLS
jgi:hypothetical protein